MRDEQIRQIKTLFQFLKESQNGRLYGDIQAGRWLIKNDETWFEDQDTRQGQATLLPTAEFVRVALQVMRGESYCSDHLLHALFNLLPRQGGMHAQGFLQAPPYSPPGVERCSGILVDILQFSTHLTCGGLGDTANALALKAHCTGSGLINAQDGFPESGFAT